MSSNELITCGRCGNERQPVQTRVPFPPPVRDRIAAEICQPCWGEWLPMQIKVINEYRLHMGEPEHRKALERFATQFFKLDGGDGTLAPGPEGGLT